MKILIIAGNARSLIANRGDLIAAMKAAGHQVSALVPAHDALPELDQLGITYDLIGLDRRKMNPLGDLRHLLELCKAIRRHKPDVVFSYTIKPVIYGSLAARLTGVQTITSMITGLGYLFTGTSRKQRLGQTIARILYRIALPCNQTVFFQNPDDLALFQSRRLLGRKTKTVMTSGSGVHLERFPYAEISSESTSKAGIRFLLIARFLQDKGILEYAEAAKILHRDYPDVVFQLLGPYDQNLAHALTQEQVDTIKQEGHLELLEATKDVRPFLQACSVYVLPSYREGTPRTVLEAMATGRPIITTDAPGCRETIRPPMPDYSNHGVHGDTEDTRHPSPDTPILPLGTNGILIPPQDAQSLAEAMRFFIDDPEQIASMGRAARQYAEERYDVHKVNAIMLEAMGL